MKVSVLGLGRMGTAIAERLLAAGHDLAVWNRTPAATAAFPSRLASPAGAWRHGDVAITMLADDAAVEAVAGELLAAAAGHTLIDMSTISPAASARIAERADAVGAAFLRAPVSGNPSVVRAGNLGLIVSGPRDAYNRVEGVLHDVGPNHFYVGPAEEARVAKLAVNLVLAGTSQLMAEALVLAERHAIDRATILSVLGGSAIGSPFVKYKTEALIADDLTSTFTTAGMYKDLALTLESARAVDVTLPVTAQVQQLLVACMAQGMGDLDFMALLPRLRREAGLS